VRRPVTWLTPSTMTVSTEWLRLLRAFILVSATARLRAPSAITASTSSLHATGTCRPRARCLMQGKEVGYGRVGLRDRQHLLAARHRHLPRACTPPHAGQGGRVG